MGPRGSRGLHFAVAVAVEVSGSLEYTDSYGEVAQVAEKRYVAEAPEPQTSTGNRGHGRSRAVTA